MRAEERPVRAEVRKRRRFPWLLVLLLLGSLYVFWILPGQLGQRPVKIDFAPSGSAAPTTNP